MSASPQLAALAPTTHALLRPDQVEEMRDEQQSLERKLDSKVIQDKGVVRDQLIRLHKQLETQAPKPYVGADLDRATKRADELKEQIREGMLSHEEMRKCPPGAIDRHRAWEKKNKVRILEYQNIQRRLNADGDDRESASIENFRPTTSTMNMDNALVSGQTFFMPPPGVAPTVILDDEEIATLKAMSPEVAAQLPLMTNEQRAEVKRIVAAEIPKRKSA